MALSFAAVRAARITVGSANSIAAGRIPRITRESHGVERKDSPEPVWLRWQSTSRRRELYASVTLEARSISRFLRNYRIEVQKGY